MSPDDTEADNLAARIAAREFQWPQDAEIMRQASDLIFRLRMSAMQKDEVLRFTRNLFDRLRDAGRFTADLIEIATNAVRDARLADLRAENAELRDRLDTARDQLNTMDRRRAA